MKKKEEIKKLIEKARGIISESKWIFSKTFKDVAPHEYLVFEDDQSVLKLFSKLVRLEGVDEKFTIFNTTKTYRYFYLDGYKYWVMSPVLNRVKVLEKQDESL